PAAAPHPRDPRPAEAEDPPERLEVPDAILLRLSPEEPLQRAAPTVGWHRRAYGFEDRWGDVNRAHECPRPRSGREPRARRDEGNMKGRVVRDGPMGVLIVFPEAFAVVAHDDHKRGPRPRGPLHAAKQPADLRVRVRQTSRVRIRYRVER